MSAQNSCNSNELMNKIQLFCNQITIWHINPRLHAQLHVTPNYVGQNNLKKNTRNGRRRCIDLSAYGQWQNLPIADQVSNLTVKLLFSLDCMIRSVCTIQAWSPFLLDISHIEGLAQDYSNLIFLARVKIYFCSQFRSW